MVGAVTATGRCVGGSTKGAPAAPGAMAAATTANAASKHHAPIASLMLLVGMQCGAAIQRPVWAAILEAANTAQRGSAAVLRSL